MTSLGTPTKSIVRSNAPAGGKRILDIYWDVATQEIVVQYEE